MSVTSKLTVVLDACVFCKLFLREDDRQQAIELVSILIEQDYQIIVPALFLYEVFAIAKMSSFPNSTVYELINKFETKQLSFLTPDKLCIEKASEICDTGHAKSGFPSFYDAIYHALAIQYNCYFVTADKKHFTKTQQLGHVVLLSNWKKVFFH